MPKLFLVVTVGPDYRLLPKFLEYYQKLGIDEFLIILNTSNTTPQNILLKYEIYKTSSWISEFSEYIKQKEERKIIEKYCAVNDWVVYADLDEFQYYPRKIKEHISICDYHGIDFLEGRLIDRVSHDGHLAKIDINKSLEEQFPLGGYITNPLLKAWDKKIVIAKTKRIVGGGHHIFLRERDNKTLPYTKKLNIYSRGILIHHFKWDNLLLTRLHKYHTLPDPSLYFWKKEISRFLQHYKKFYRINIQDRRFKFSYVKNKLDI